LLCRGKSNGNHRFSHEIWGVPQKSSLLPCYKGGFPGRFIPTREAFSRINGFELGGGHETLHAFGIGVLRTVKSRHLVLGWMEKPADFWDGQNNFSGFGGV